ncbi:hypothetical protein J4474_01885 [Candidatus Pacearchaeota archaeon]|nr:hypothetical protein [Candidatus Pacearchaeota archaeon]
MGKSRKPDGYRMIAEFRERAKFFCDGYGNEFSSILMDTDLSFESGNPEKNKKIGIRVEYLKELIDTMELTGKEKDYDLLSRIKEKIQDLPLVFAEAVEKKEISAFYEFYHDIKVYGDAYRVRLNELRRKIRKWFGNDNIKFSTTNIFGKLEKNVLGKDYLYEKTDF